MTKRGYIYFIGSRISGLTKIGYSTHPERRLRQLQRSFHDRLFLIHQIEVADMPMFEAAFQYNARRVRIFGEWFKLSTAYLEWVTDLPRLTDEYDEAWIATTTKMDLLEVAHA